MCGPYWSQWDRSDLDSWQGKDYPAHHEEDDTDLEHNEDDADLEQECNCCCSRNPCGNCMDCLGMSWSDFL